MLKGAWAAFIPLARPSAAECQTSHFGKQNNGLNRSSFTNRIFLFFLFYRSADRKLRHTWWLLCDATITYFFFQVWMCLSRTSWAADSRDSCKMKFDYQSARSGMERLCERNERLSYCFSSKFSTFPLTQTVKTKSIVTTRKFDLWLECYRKSVYVCKALINSLSADSLFCNLGLPPTSHTSSKPQHARRH